jgi:hypothetical protein
MLCLGCVFLDVSQLYPRVTLLYCLCPVECVTASSYVENSLLLYFSVHDIMKNISYSFLKLGLQPGEIRTATYQR